LIRAALVELSKTDEKDDQECEFVMRDIVVAQGMSLMQSEIRPYSANAI
jgi:hypothetical protein